LDEPVEAQVSRAAFEEIQADLRLALEQVAVLREDLAEAERRHAVAVFSQSESGSQEDESSGDLPEMAEVVSVIQELRQPMSSILGYTDLLLGESVGILGALQRKFLERIRASVERLGGLTDDLIQMVALEESNLKLNPEMLHVDHVIEAAISEAMECLQEKNIFLKKEIAASLPPLRADRNALEQVLIHLLQNAGERTPSEGEVNIVARAESKEHEPGYILIQVSDSGGGIPPHELPRVFSRLYPAGSLFSDLGDTLAPFSDRILPSPEMDLSTVKALVEAHGGRIWVDSTLGKGSTFSTLLPLVDEPESG
jgi:signal transduction histidine kinase